MTPTSPCPSRELLRELLENRLPPSAQAEIEAHLETCADCQQSLEGLVAGRESWSHAAQHLQDTPAEPTLAGTELRAAMDQWRTPGHATTRVDQGAPADIPLDFLAPAGDPRYLGRLGQYEIIEILGRGGFGVVFKAFDPALHRIVAVKALAPQLATNAAARRRFIREAQAAAAVSHDHVITIHAVEESGPVPYIVMQLVAGMSLQDKLDTQGPLELKEILRVGLQTASGLAAAHAQGLVHRDVKPANILLENGIQRVKLTDFGLARAVDDSSLTQSGVIAGTPQFMSPEQARGENIDFRADLFSLGSVMYAMCTGRAPFRASTTLGVLKRVCEDTPRPIRELNPEMPDWLEEIVARLMAKEPAARLQSAKEVAELLGQHLAHLQQPQIVPLPARLGPQQPVERAAPTGAAACGTSPDAPCGCAPPADRAAAESPSGELETAAGAAAAAMRELGRELFYVPRPGWLWALIAVALLLAAIVVVQHLSGELDEQWPIDVCAAALAVGAILGYALADVRGGFLPVPGWVGFGLLLAVYAIGLMDLQGELPGEIAEGLGVVTLAAALFYLLAYLGGALLRRARLGPTEIKSGWSNCQVAMFLGLLALLTVPWVVKWAGGNPLQAIRDLRGQRALVQRGLATVRFELLDPQMKLRIMSRRDDVIDPPPINEVSEEISVSLLPGEYTWLAYRDGQLIHSRWLVLVENQDLKVAVPFTSELADLQGEWLVESFESAGERSTEGNLGTIRFERDQLTFLAPNNAQDAYRITLDSTTTPGKIERHIDGNQPAERGIYRLEGERLFLCFAPPGAHRPTQFGTSQINKYELIVCRRKSDSSPTNQLSADGWQPLLVREEVKRWQGNFEAWTFGDHELTGRAAPEPGVQKNFFLWYPQKFRDFELKFQVRVQGANPGDAPNAGVQLRSQVVPLENGAVLRGPQVDLGTGVWGGLWGENLGGWLAKPDKTQLQRVVQLDDFNDFYVRCQGKQVTIQLNGLTTIQGEFPLIADDGLIGFQVLKFPDTWSAEVTFRNVLIRELPGGSSQGPAAADGTGRRAGPVEAPDP